MNWRHLERELKTDRIVPVYLFYGEEDYLLERYLKILKEKIIPPSAQAFDYQELDGCQLSAADFILYTDTLPALAPRRMVVIKEPEKEMLAAGAGVLAEYVEKPIPTTCLVIVINGKMDRRLKVFKNINKRGLAVEFSPVKGRALQAWLRREAKAKGYTLAPEAATALARGNNLRQAMNDLFKAMNYIGRPGVIGMTDMQKLLSTTTEATIFQLVDALGGRNAVLAISLLRQLLGKGEAALGVAAMLARQLRLIYQYHLLKDRREMASQLGLMPFVANKVAAQANNFSLDTAGKALAELLKVDTGIKTGQGEAAALLEKAIWTITIKI